MAKLCRKLKWLVFFWDTVYTLTLALLLLLLLLITSVEHKYGMPQLCSVYSQIQYGYHSLLCITTESLNNLHTT